MPKNSKKTKIKSYGNISIYLLVFIVVVAALVGGIYYKSKLLPKSISDVLPNVPSTQKPQETNTQEITTRLFNGKVKRLDQDLGLFVKEEYSSPDFKESPVYYEAGTYTKGKFKGYTRYIATRRLEGPGGSREYILASNDQKIFILDKTYDYENFLDNSDYLLEFDKTKVTSADFLDSEHPVEIDLNNKFSIARNFIASQSVPLGQDQQDVLITDFSSYKKLQSNLVGFNFYQGKYNDNDPILNQYTEGTTKVYVTDSTGLAYSYTISPTGSYKSYLNSWKDYKIVYSEWAKIVNNSDSAPMQPIKPYLSYMPKDSKNIYQEYAVAIPQNCASDTNTLVVKNISPSDLVKLTDSEFGEIYVLKNKNHPLYKAQYDTKFHSGEDYGITNTGQVIKPSLQEYVQREPLLFIQDNWGRTLMLGEYYYLTGGGCGKPVIYLYPTTPTKVSIKMQTPIKFDVTIPSYDNGWNVMAYPDGKLVDLQPQSTDCNSIDYTKKGSEYAKDACMKNSYPYIYWSGRSTEKPYPSLTGGWIVERNNLGIFMNETLDSIEFTAQEKNDMLEYWLPKMMGADTPYFRISFLQTQEMNQIAPMKVTPAPQSTYRLFLDYLPLNTIPAVKPSAQKLDKIVRNGFTLVEWGGLKR